MPHGIFNAFPEKYDRWYDDHRETYLQELGILERYSRGEGWDLEIGVGTGRFAAPLGIRLGLDPSLPMLRMARARGVEVIRGIAEALPLSDASLQSVLVMTSLCYFDDPWRAFGEIYRVLAPGGRLTIGFLGRGEEIAVKYRENGEKGTFLAHARFSTPEEVTSLLARAGFTMPGEVDTGGAGLRGFHVVTATRPGT